MEYVLLPNYVLEGKENEKALLSFLVSMMIARGLHSADLLQLLKSFQQTFDQN
jgi:hypothetical protein